jgi:hypothetical protein
MFIAMEVSTTISICSKQKHISQSIQNWGHSKTLLKAINWSINIASEAPNPHATDTNKFKWQMTNGVTLGIMMNISPRKPICTKKEEYDTPRL